MRRTSWAFTAALALTTLGRCDAPCCGQAFRVDTIEITGVDATAAEIDAQLSGLFGPAFAGSPGHNHIESSAIRGRFRAVIWSDLDQKALNAATRRAVETLKTKVPAGSVISWMDWNADELPALWIALSSEKLSPIRLADMGRDQVIPRLKSAAGVRRVELRGAPNRKQFVDLNVQSMAALGVTPADVATTVKPPELARSATAEEIADLVVKTANGSPIRIKDVANVHADVVQTERTTFDRREGQLLALTVFPPAKPPGGGQLEALAQQCGIHMEVACDLSREEATLLEVAIPNAYDRLDAAADQVENAILQSPLHYAHSIRLPVENDVIRLLLTGTERESVDRAMSNLARQLPQFTVRDCQVGLGCLAPFPVKAMLYGADEARLRQWAEATAKGVQSIGMSAAAVATGSEIPVPTMVVDREKAARASIPVEEIDRALRSVDKKSLLDPQTASDTLSRITVTDRNGIRLGLSSVVQLKIESQPRAVVRWDGRRVILINAATMPGKTNPETEAVLAAAAAEERSSLRLPEDYVIIGAVK